MRINGSFERTPSGVLLPVLSASVRRADGGWASCDFLLDTGAERTVFCFEDFDKLGIEGTQTSGFFIQGIGGRAGSRDLDTQIRLLRTDGQFAPLNGPFMACTDPAAADMSVLGRDLLYHFAVLMDRSRDVVCLLHGVGTYQLTA
jgi:Retroviral aspartyl protease